MGRYAKAAADAIAQEFDTRRKVFTRREGERMDAVKELLGNMNEVAVGFLDATLEGDDGLDAEIDALLAEFDTPVQRQVIQMEADAWAVELYRLRLQGAGGGDVAKAIEEVEANIQAIAELYGVDARPLAPETKAELKRQTVERFRVDFQRLQARARVQLKNGNQAGLKATEEAQERIRETVKGIAAME